MRRDIQIRVTDLLLVESSTYRDQFLRPYKTEIRGGMIDAIGERLQKSRRFTPSILASIANQFIVPDHNPRGIIEIPHGWDERRGRFILNLEIILGTGDIIRQVVMGYTNTTGFSTTNRVDHDMEFYINSIHMLTERTIKTDRGYRTTLVPTNITDVHADRDNAGARRRGDRRYTLRPEDIYSTLDAENNGLDMVDDLADLRTTLNRSSIKSASSNRLSSRYMSRVLNSRQKAIENSEGMLAEDLNATAQGYVQESYTSEDQFLKRLSDVQDLDETTTTSFFTFRHLLQIDRDADRHVNANLFDSDARAATDYRNFDDVEDLNGKEEWDRIASLIAIAVPAIMLENCIHRASFQVNNRGFDQDFEFVPGKITSFIEGLHMRTFIERLEERLIDELFLPITGANRYDFGLELTCRVFGDINFKLYWDGKDRGRYVFPTFCDSLSSPIITDTIGDVKKLSRDFDDLFTELLPNTLGGDRGSFNF